MEILLKIVCALFVTLYISGKYCLLIFYFIHKVIELISSNIKKTSSTKVPIIIKKLIKKFAFECLNLKKLMLCCYYVIFTFVSWALYKIKYGSFCMNRTAFRDLWAGVVLVKTCNIALRWSTFLKGKKIHHVIKFSFLLVLCTLS